MNSRTSQRNLSLLIVVLVLALATTGQSQDRPRYINVTGTADVKVAPDEVVVTLGIETTHKNIRDAIKLNDSNVKKLIAVLEKQGIESKHIQAGLIRLVPNSEDEPQQFSKGGKFQGQQMQMPNPPPPNANAPNPANDPFGGPAAESTERKIKDYTATKTIVFLSKDLPQLEAVLVSIYETGTTTVGGISYQISSAKKLRERMRTDAILAAKVKAELLTAAIGQKIGKAVRIEEASGGGESGLPYAADPFGSPMPSIFRYVPSDSPHGAASIAPETITVSASVTVWFELP